MESNENINDNTILLLYKLIDKEDKVSFSVKCDEGYIVSCKRIDRNGNQLDSDKNILINNEEIYETTFNDNDMYLMITITNNGTSNITEWIPHSYRNLVEIKCKLSNGTKVKCGDMNKDHALKDLKYFTWI